MEYTIVGEESIIEKDVTTGECGGIDYSGSRPPITVIGQEIRIGEGAVISSGAMIDKDIEKEEA